jgi:hypothetical protein
VSADHAATGAASERPGAITKVHRYDLSLPREEVRRLISEVSRYRGWWPWLRVFDGAPLAEGEAWRSEVQPPVPCPVRFRVVIGTATLQSSLAPGNTALPLVSRFAPLARFGHDWILDSGARQFTARAIEPLVAD